MSELPLPSALFKREDTKKYEKVLYPYHRLSYVGAPLRRDIANGRVRGGSSRSDLAEIEGIVGRGGYDAHRTGKGGE